MTNGKNSFLTFLYHEVVDNPRDSGFQRESALPYKHKVSEFIENIEIIVKLRKDIITINEIEKHDSGTLLTFDDGGKSAMFIAECLEKYGVKGHFFITTSLIGDKYFLNESEIIDLHQRGHIIGSHSHTHPNVFRSLSYREMQDEWKQSRRILEEILNDSVKCCSIPGGDSNYNSYMAAYDNGFRYVFDSEPYLKTRDIGGARVFGRFYPKAGTSLKEITKLCELKGIKRARIKRRFKNIVKSIVFPVYSKIHNSRRHND